MQERPTYRPQIGHDQYNEVESASGLYLKRRNPSTCISYESISRFTQLERLSCLAYALPDSAKLNVTTQQFPEL